MKAKVTGLVRQHKLLDGLEPEARVERQMVTVTTYGKKPGVEQIESLLDHHHCVTLMPDGSVIGRDFHTIAWPQDEAKE